MTTFILVLLLILVPTASDSQPIKAKVDKQNIYRDSGKVMGGQRTDGKDLYSIKFGKHDTFERLVLSIHKWTTDENLIPKGDSPPAAIPCQFEVTYEEYPFRLYFDLEGVRWTSATLPTLASSEYISSMYFIFPDSWGNARLAVTFNKPMQYEVFELHDPARIVVDIKARDSSAIKFPPIYSLRSRSSDDQDELREVQYRLYELKNPEDDWGREKEIPKGKNIRIIKSQDNKLFIEEGYYKTKQEALNRQKIYAKEGITLFIEKRKADEIPKSIQK
ncbi:MAG: hypothetical protein NTY36_00180 [Deltaproteobacteria bacterium]|nr:hypothetical protein [Deltaproteobacteria bacterium]